MAESKKRTLSSPLPSFPTRLFGQVGFHDPLEIYAFKEEGEVSKVPTVKYPKTRFHVCAIHSSKNVLRGVFVPVYSFSNEKIGIEFFE